MFGRITLATVSVRCSLSYIIEYLCCVYMQTGSTNRRNGSQQSSLQSKHSVQATTGRPSRKAKNAGSSEQLPRCIRKYNTAQQVRTNQTKE